MFKRTGETIKEVGFKSFVGYIFNALLIILFIFSGVVTVKAGQVIVGILYCALAALVIVPHHRLRVTKALKFVLLVIFFFVLTVISGVNNTPEKQKYEYFSLEQVNNKHGSQWKIWEQPEDYPSRGLRAFQAAEAALFQGETAFDSFHMALLRARHEQRRDIADKDTLIEVAESVDLMMAQFQDNLSDRQLLAKLAEDHTFAVETLGIFGTPTIVFPKGQAVFLKMSPPPSPEECLPLFTKLRHLIEQTRYIQEIKRPQPLNA